MKKNIKYLTFGFLITILSYYVFYLEGFAPAIKTENLVRDFFFLYHEREVATEIAKAEDIDSLQLSQTDKDTMIIKIDDQSLGNIGKWPWYRDAYSTYINAVGKFSPKQMQIDLSFILPERVPQNVVNELKGEPKLLQRVGNIFQKADDKFAQALKNTDNVYTDLFLVPEERPDISYIEGIKNTEAIVENYSRKAPDTENPNYASLEPVLDKFARVCKLSTVNTIPDIDQKLRRFPLIHVYQNASKKNYYYFSSVLNMLITYYRIPRKSVQIEDTQIVLKDANIPISNRIEPKQLNFEDVKSKIKIGKQLSKYNKNLYNCLLYELVIEQYDEDNMPSYPIHILEENGEYHLIDGKEIYDVAIKAKAKKIQCIFYKKQDVIIETPKVEIPTPAKYNVLINYPARMEMPYVDEEGESRKYNTIASKSFFDGYRVGFVPDFPNRGKRIPEKTISWFIDFCNKKRQEVQIQFSKEYPEGGEEEFQSYLLEGNIDGRFFFYAMFFEQFAEQLGSKDKLSFKEYRGYYKQWAQQMQLSKEYVPYLSTKQILSALYEVYSKGFNEYYGKYLFIGAYSSGMADDVKTTPFGEMFGIATMAAAFDTIVTNNILTSIPENTEIIVLFAFAFLFSLIYANSSIKYCLPLFLLAFIGIIAFGYYLFSENDTYFTITPLLTTNVILFGGILSLRLLTEERNRKFLQNTFSNYISPELIDIMYNAKTKPELGGRSGDFTAFFTDIQGFSTFSEKLNATQVVELLNEYLTAMTDILLEEGGTLDKYEGDAIIAFYGAPLDLKDHALRSCKTAIRMQDKLEDLKALWRLERSSENRNVKEYPDEEWAPGDKWPKIVHEMRMRVGINIGEIVVGNMGSKTRMNYTMMGDAVNLAARLEAGAKQFGVYTMVSHFMADHMFENEEGNMTKISDVVEMRFLDKITVVGKLEPIKVYEVIALKGDLSPREKQLLPMYEKAVELYQSMQWDKAIAKFKETLIVERFPDGKTTPSEVFIKRCEEFKITPPVAEGEEWDGVYRLTSK